MLPDDKRASLGSSAFTSRAAACNPLPLPCNADLLRTLKERSEANRDERKRALADKYCMRQVGAAAGWSLTREGRPSQPTRCCLGCCEQLATGCTLP